MTRTHPTSCLARVVELDCPFSRGCESQSQLYHLLPVTLEGAAALEAALARGALVTVTLEAAPTAAPSAEQAQAACDGEAGDEP